MGWQVTLCDPIWQVILRSSEIVQETYIVQPRLTFNRVYILKQKNVKKNKYECAKDQKLADAAA